MAASPRFLFIAVIVCHGVAGGDVSDSKCSVQVLQFWREVEALIKGPACRGLSNARVCSADAFSSLLGDEDAGKVRGWRGRAITPQTRTPPTPWLTIGNLAFTGNSYLDFLVYTLFFRDVRRKRPLTYVETGGSNGVHASNSYFFDFQLGWTGLLIEPSRCAICELPMNRPNATNVRAGICPTATTRSFKHMAAFCPGRQGVCKQMRVGRTDALVPCLPLTHILKEQGITHVDFFSLDVEGDWRMALDSLDLAATSVSVLLIECSPRNECEEQLQQRGFEFVFVTGSDALAWRREARPSLCRKIKARKSAPLKDSSLAQLNSPGRVKA